MHLYVFVNGQPSILYILNISALLRATTGPVFLVCMTSHLFQETDYNISYDIKVLELIKSVTL